MYKKAAKQKLRFNTTKGLMPAEDLYDFTLADLNAMAKEVNRMLRGLKDENFIEVASGEVKTFELKLKILKDVISTKVSDKNKSAKAIETKAYKQKILEALSRKKDSNLGELSEDELQKMLDKLTR